jgi:hypothetical protein
MCRPGAEGEADLVASPPDLWESDAVRRSARVSAARMPVLCETYPPNAVRRELTALDISATGLGAIWHGPPLGIGTPVRISLDGPRDPRWVPTIVVWSAPGTFGVSNVGLRFRPERRHEQELILVWRDEASRRAAAAG